MLAAVIHCHHKIQFKKWVPLLLALSLFAVPISSTARGIFIGLSLVFIIFSPSYYADLRSLLTQPWCQALLFFFFIIMLASAWGPANAHDKISVIKKYSKLLFLPFFVVGFYDLKARSISIYAYLAAMLITCVLSILKGFDLLIYSIPDPGQVFNNHVITGMMMAFAAYLSAWLAIQQRTIKMRVFYAVLLFLFSYQILFINTGRTGYMMFSVLMPLFLIQVFSWKKAIFLLVLTCMLLPISYYQSKTMQTEIQKAIVDLRDIQHGSQDNRIGFRVQFQQFAKKLFLQHPWIGSGTASYTYFFKQENPCPAWHVADPSQKRMYEPHSQYWLVAAESGLLGLIAFLLFFGGLFLVALKLNSMRPIAIASLVIFIIGNFSDSLLFYSGTGYFFLLFMAMSLAEQGSNIVVSAHGSKNSGHLPRSH